MSSSSAVQSSQLSTFSVPLGSASAFSDGGRHGHSQATSSSSSNVSSTPHPVSSTSTSSNIPTSDRDHRDRDRDANEGSGASTLSCKQCGSKELDSDPSRGDTVCMSCGYVLEESIIVSEVCFEEDGHGGASAIGQFVSSESKGGGGIGLSSGGGPGGGPYHQGVGKESREITLRAAKRKITEVAQQLRLNQHCIDMSFNFFKMALHKQLTKGRRHPLTVAACIYMTCRIEGTPHLLIDFSDVVQMDIYALGRAYIQLSRALFINIPAVDPCMYILRFAHKFNLGPKTHEVGMTAVRLVQRMKRDWLHLGRRPSGLCGAALLIAARLHNFSRTVQDVIRVVKVHETTLRKRLIEFGETPSSSLTIEEFMSVDLEEEHDPPSFKVARIKDREHLQRLLEQEDVHTEMTELQRKIEEELEKRRRVRREKDTAAAAAAAAVQSVAALEPGLISGAELETASRYLLNSTFSLINKVVEGSEEPETAQPPSPLKQESQVRETRAAAARARARSGSTETDASTTNKDVDRILMPPPSPAALHQRRKSGPATTTITILPEAPPPAPPVVPVPPDRRQSKEESSGTEEDEREEGDDDEEEEGEIDLSGIDDAEIDGYIMTDAEVERKRIIWDRLNNDYMIEQERKRAQKEQDILDGKYDKKKRPTPGGAGGASKTPKGPSTIAGGSTFQAKSASEAIKIMLTERKMSSKINYDVLRKLASSVAGDDEGASAMPSVKSDKDELVTVIESGAVIPAGGKRRAGTVKQEPAEKKQKLSVKQEKNNSQPAVQEEEEPPPETSEVSEDEGQDQDREQGQETEHVEEHEYEEEEEEEDEQEEQAESEAEPEPSVEEEVVVETGPVRLPPPTTEEVETEEDDEEYAEEDEDDEAHISARELLTKFRGDDDQEEGYEDYYD